jgi:hypothetical protein
VSSGVVCKNENGSARPNLNRQALPFLIFFGLPLKSGWLMSRDSGFGCFEGSIYG